jgi:transposase
MTLSRRTFTKEFKEGAVQRLELGASVAEVARACEVNRNVLYRWRRELRKHAAKPFPGEGHRQIEESRIAELEHKVGPQAMEIDFLHRCFQRVEEQRRLQGLTTCSSSTPASRTKWAWHH